MLYPKNVPPLERLVRIVLGLALVGVALWKLSPGSLGVLVVPGLLLGSALFIMLTGFIGWCPACAMVGRQIHPKERH